MKYWLIYTNFPQREHLSYTYFPAGLIGDTDELLGYTYIFSGENIDKSLMLIIKLYIIHLLTLRSLSDHLPSILPSFQAQMTTYNGFIPTANKKKKSSTISELIIAPWHKL